MSKIHETKVFISDCEKLMATVVVKYEQGKKNMYVHYAFPTIMNVPFDTEDTYSEEFDNIIRKLRAYAETNNCVLWA